MPPEYLTRAEADKRFRELEEGFRTSHSGLKEELADMRVDNQRRDGAIELLSLGIAEIKKMLADRTQIRWMLFGLAVTNLITLGTALFAKATP